MRKITKQIETLKQQLVDQLDKTKAIGGGFLTSLIRDSLVRHLCEFSHTDSLPRIAYWASFATITALSTKLYLGSTTIQHIATGVFLGMLALGATEHISKPIISGSLRGARKVIQDTDIYVTHTYAMDIVTGLYSVLNSKDGMELVGRIASQVIGRQRVTRIRQDHFMGITS